MSLSSVEESLLVAAYYRGGMPEDHVWGSNSDQVITLSLFYSGDISVEDCAERFAIRHYVGKLYDMPGELADMIKARYRNLIELIREHADLILGGGDLRTPADPTYTACRLTHAGRKLAYSLLPKFPRKPDLPNWPDNPPPDGFAG
jgi:hypothetical protein